jgi:hypothetical protein
MPKIISAFNGESPIGDTIAKLGASMFGGQTTDNALKNEQLYALQRENTERDNFAKMVADGGIMSTANNPIAQAMILAAGLDPRNNAYLGRMDAATRYGADDPRTANWQVASGDPYSSTGIAFNKNLAETARNNDLQSSDRRYGVDVGANTDRFKHTTLSAQDEAINNWRRYNTDQTQLTERTKPFSVFNTTTGQVDYVPTNEVNAGDFRPIISETDQKGLLLGQNWDKLPALNPNQLQVLGANPSADRLGTPRNYIIPGAQPIITYDGVTSARDGTPLPAGGYLGTVEGSATDTGVTKAVATDLQSDTIANKKFNFLLDKGMALTNDPTLFGPEGYVRSTLQEIGQGLKGVSTLIDPDPAKAAAEVQTARQEAQRYGVNIPELYDPRLSEVETIWGLLVYQGASALAGQENRSVSDKDVQAMRQILGSPQSLFSSANSMKSKLTQAREVVSGYDAISREALDGVAPVTSPFGAQPTVVDPNAQPMQIKGVDDYNALPPGAKYIDPNGVPRVKGAR